MKNTHTHHIIPKHAGGTDHPSNLVELTVEEHAEAHRKLWEKYGMWEDELAWKGLAGLIGKEEIVRQVILKGCKKGMTVLREKYPELTAWPKGKPRSEETKRKRKIKETTTGIKKTDSHKKNISISNSREWIITYPDGNSKKIVNLQTFCKENGLDSSKMSVVASGARKHHKGYKCIKLGA